VPFLLAAVWYASVPVFRKLGGEPDLYPPRHRVSAVLMFVTKAGRERLRPSYRIDLGRDEERFDVEAFLDVGCLFPIWVAVGVLSVVFLGRAIFG
jgi:hypothetical protein